jgi:hypothetical protein
MQRLSGDTGLVETTEEATMSNISAQQSRPRASFWSSRREASLNWLALGLLLAAWNASDNDAAKRRPDSLRGYAFVSARAANRMTPQNW